MFSRWFYPAQLQSGRCSGSRVVQGVIILIIGLITGTSASGQNIILVAGDTAGCTIYHRFEPPVRIVRTGAGPALQFPFDVDQDGIMDIRFIAANSFGAKGMASNFIHVVALDSAVLRYSHIDSTLCYYGFKPVYIAGLLNMGDTIQNQQNFTQEESIVEEEKWFLKDTCQVMISDTGRYYLGVKLLADGLKGLAWIDIRTYAPNFNGFSADISAIAYKSRTSPVVEYSEANAIVFPNPSNGALTISLKQPGRSTLVTVNDLTGRRILQFVQNESMATFSLSSGIYLIRFDEADRIPYVRKVVIF